MTYTDLRKTERQPLAQIVPLKVPFTLYIDPTSICNFRCVQCPVSDVNYHTTKDYMPLTAFERICREVLELGKLKSLKLYLQGEPLLHPEIGKLVMVGHRAAERVEITSNCSILSEAKAEDLILADLDYLQVSVYGSSEGKHRAVTKSPISLEKIRHNVLYLRQMRDQVKKTKPYIFARFFKGTPPEEAAFFAQWQDIADECGIDELHDWDGQLPLRERYYGIAPVVPVSSTPCPYPFYTLTVKASGSVTICCVDWSDATEVGNVYKESIKDIWNGERLREFRRMHLERRRDENPACKNCRLPERSPILDSLESLTAEEFESR